jgi:Raf kinase inhibitor-like YbhB/YbcL family protein
MLCQSKVLHARADVFKSFGPRKPCDKSIANPGIGTQARGNAAMSFKLTSQSFKDGDYLANIHILSKEFGFGCAGGNQSPQLSWSGAPSDTKSFALTCFDPDAPTGSGFWHWLIVNIPATTTELPLDAGNPGAPKLPAGALQTRTDIGKPGYIGPCPPEGDHPHRYIFTIFAVSQESLAVTADTSAAVIGFNLHFNTLAKATLMGLFKR